MNGGLLDLSECIALLRKSRPATQELTAEDIERAVHQLRHLGPGVELRSCAGRRLLCSVPEELSADPAKALDLAASAGGRVCEADLERHFGWRPERAESALAHCIREGLCWVDTQDKDVPRWCWFPSIALAAMDKEGSPSSRETSVGVG
ncbi:unnamed protein product [Polarella glacialis]|uniref:ESCRT-II complex subunit VPS22 n=1 Tax=Polarella glacialis TaxID=89957 RepID=A0A813LZ95_POLGL|nr:unnamed protein product [Polarella glacialis]